MENFTPYGGDAGQRIAHALTGFGLTILDLRKAYDNLQFQQETQKQQYELQLRAATAREEAMRADFELSKRQMALRESEFTEQQRATGEREKHAGEALDVEKDREARLAKSAEQEQNRRRIGAVYDVNARRRSQLDREIMDLEKIRQRPKGTDIGELLRTMSAANPNLRSLLGAAERDPAGPAAANLSSQLTSLIAAKTQERDKLLQEGEQLKSQLLEYGVDADAGAEPAETAAATPPEPLVTEVGDRTFELRSPNGATFRMGPETPIADLYKYLYAIERSDGAGAARDMWKQLAGYKNLPADIAYPTGEIARTVGTGAQPAAYNVGGRTRGIGQQVMGKVGGR